MQAKGEINDISAESTEILILLINVSAMILKRALSFQQHRKVLDKGKPDDIMPAIKGTKVRGDEGRWSLFVLFVLH